jgi:hypothetical protein
MDPGNVEWQHDLALSHAQIESLLARQRERDPPWARFENGRAIVEQLKIVSPDYAVLPKELAWFEHQIARTQGHR